MLQRLLPDAYRDDTEEAAEFRRFTERSLTSAKVANAETVLATLRDAGLDETKVDEAEDQEPLEVELDAAAVQAWLRTLTDVRLALAIRLGIRARAVAVVAVRLDLPRRSNPTRNLGAPFGERRQREVGRRYAGDLDMEIDAVEERTGNACLIIRGAARGTAGDARWSSRARRPATGRAPPSATATWIGPRQVAT